MFETLEIQDIQSDRILTLPQTTWEEYERLSDDSNSGYKISYFNNEITIVSPSRNHEIIAQIINLLVITFCRKYQISYFNLGSADIKKQFIAVKQPDNSYCFKSKRDIPDLAVEVNFTSGSIDDLEKYKLLGVPEVWILRMETLPSKELVPHSRRQNSQITFYRIIDGEYISQAASFFLFNPDPESGMALDSIFLNRYIKRGLTEDNLTLEADFFNAL